MKKERGKKMSIEKYFNEQAAKYDVRLSSGILGLVRKNEAQVIFKHLHVQKGDNILDIPCGTGFYADIARQQGANVYGIDISPSMLDIFKKKGYTGELGDLEHFSLGKKFDKVLSAGGFEFCNNHTKILDNLISHTKNGGYIVLFFSGNNIFGKLYQLHHFLLHHAKVFVFSRKKIESLCKRADIKCVSIETCGLYGYVVMLKKTKDKKNR